MTFDAPDKDYYSLQPALVSAYLLGKGWTADQDGKLTRWTHADSTEPISLDAENVVVADLAEKLAQVEHRPVSNIVTELRHADADILRVTPVGAAQDTLLLEQANRLMRGVQKLLTSASRAVLEPGPVLAGKKPKEVNDYLRGLQIGIPEPESYTVTVLSPLRESDQESLARQTFLRLAATLHELESLTERAFLDTDTRRRLITNGLSAELCDALAILIGKAPQKTRGHAAPIQSLTLEFVWSPRLDPPVGTPSSMLFEVVQVDDFKDFAEALRETPPQENFQMQGAVSDLKRAHHEGSGKIVVRNVTREAPEKVTLELEEELYSLAVQAHQMKTLVICTGALVKNGRGYELIEASIMPVEPLPEPEAAPAAE